MTEVIDYLTLLDWSRDESRTPFILLTNHTDNLSRIIHWWTGGPSHIMWCHAPALVASQNWVFQERPLGEYIGHEIEVLEYEAGWTDYRIEYKRKVLQYIDYQIKRKAVYDVLGIIGHSIFTPSLQNPRRRYCVEAVFRALRYGFGLYNIKGEQNTPIGLATWLREHGWITTGVRKYT